MAAGQPGVAGDDVAGLGDGDVGDEQAGHAFALALGVAGLLKTAGKSVASLADAGLLRVG